MSLLQFDANLIDLREGLRQEPCPLTPAERHRGLRERRKRAAQLRSVELVRGDFDALVPRTCRAGSDSVASAGLRR